MKRSVTLVIGLALLLSASAVSAAQTRRWIADTAKEFLQGKGDGVAVTIDGRLVGVDRWEAAAPLDEPVVVAGGLDRDGSLIVGTGYPANLYRIKGRSSRALDGRPGRAGDGCSPDKGRSPGGDRGAGSALPMAQRQISTRSAASAAVVSGTWWSSMAR